MYSKPFVLKSPTNPQYLGVKQSDLLKVPNGYTKNLWKTRTANSHKHDLDVVGYPRVDDVDYTVVDIEFLKDLEQDLDNLGRGDKIWVAREYGTWNVYRINETESYVTNINNVNPGFLTIVTDVVHNLNDDDIVLMIMIINVILIIALMMLMMTILEMMIITMMMTAMIMMVVTTTVMMLMLMMMMMMVVMMM